MNIDGRTFFFIIISSDYCMAPEASKIDCLKNYVSMISLDQIEKWLIVCLIFQELLTTTNATLLLHDPKNVQFTKSYLIQ